LRWQDVDREAKTIFFREAKGGRSYHVPMCDLLAELLTAYKRRDDVPPSDEGWLFPSNRKAGEHLECIRDRKNKASAPHKLRHSYRTTLAQLGAAPDSAKLLLGHSLGGVSGGYVTTALVLESLRPIANAVARTYVDILGDLN